MSASWLLTSNPKINKWVDKTDKASPLPSGHAPGPLPRSAALSGCPFVWLLLIPRQSTRAQSGWLGRHCSGDVFRRTIVGRELLDPDGSQHIKFMEGLQVEVEV